MVDGMVLFQSDGVSAQVVYDIILSTKTHSTPAHTDMERY